MMQISHALSSGAWQSFAPSSVALRNPCERTSYLSLSELMSKLTPCCAGWVVVVRHAVKRKSFDLG